MYLKSLNLIYLLEYLKRNNIRICILSKSGTGKSTLIKKLETNFPNLFYGVKSFTTRGVRKEDPNDINTHEFVDNTFWENNKDNAYVAYHSPKGYVSWADESSFKDGFINLYAIDIIAYKELYEQLKDKCLIYAVYLDLDENSRKKRIESRGDSYSLELHLDRSHDNGLTEIKYLDASKDPNELCNQFVDVLISEFEKQIETWR